MRAMPTDVVVFEIGPGRYAIPLADTVEFIRMPAIVPLPKAPAVIEGIFDLRGIVVPVLDIRRRFGLSARAPRPADHLVVARSGMRQVALRADRVTGVVRLDAADIANPATIASRIGYVTSVAKLADGLALIHDLATFLTEAEAWELDDALDGVAAPCP